MRRVMLAIAASGVLHGAVLAALLPREETPPRALPTLSVELVDGLPGEATASARSDPRPAGAAPAQNARPAPRAEENRTGGAAEPSQEPVREEEAAEPSNAEARRPEPQTEPADSRETPGSDPAREDDAEARRESAERTERANRERERREEEEANRRRRAQAEAERERRRRAEAEAEARRRERERERPAARSRRGGEGEQQTASAAVPAGELVPPRYGVGGGANPLPPYPETARYLGQQGTVLLRVRVDAEGRPARVEIAESSGYEALDDAALQTVRERWRFSPARRGGTPVAATVTVPIRFRLDPS